MSNLSEGDWPATILGATRGEDKGALVVRINARIDDGPDKGKNCTYEDTVTARSNVYIRRSCVAVGWKGKTLDSLTADVDAWIKETGGRSTVSIKHLEVKSGKQYNKWVEGGCKGPKPVWAKVQAVGRGPKPLAPATKESISDADDLMRMAAEADGGTPPSDDAPDAANSDDIPFITSRLVRDENGQVL